MKIDGSKLVGEIKRQGITQKSLADRCEISRTTINNIVNGRTCSDETAKKIADALGLQLKELV